MRKMATIKQINNILPIEGADQIELAVIGGWKVVVKKGEYSAGDYAVYCEIDSWIPHTLAPFLTKPGQFPKEYEGVEGQRLRTIKLRGQISQGLLLPLAVVPEGMWEPEADCSEALGIVKWEPPAEFVASQAKGNFPHFIPKTDQERIQNVSRRIERWNDDGAGWEVTEKLDGSSMTAYIREGIVGVCSRNLELKEDMASPFWQTAVEQKLVDALKEMDGNFALQGELVGPGIQGNSYGLDELKFYLYDVFDIDRQEYLLPLERDELAQRHNILHVPVVQHIWAALPTVEAILQNAEGKSLVGKMPQREGFVYKRLDGPESFKAISNKWLLKNE